LFWAAGRGQKGAVELLLANKADVNAKDNKGNTPLHIAKAQRQDAVAELLRQYGGQD
jgi:ankyrin repeat protein